MIRQRTDANGADGRHDHLGTLYNVARQRTDAWNRLRDASRRLRRLAPSDPEVGSLTPICEEALRQLHSLERYCGFPGKRALAQLTDHLRRGRWESLARQCIRLVRLLNTNGYRRLDLTASGFRDYADLLNVTVLSDMIHGRIQAEQRPYFEVLVVDDLSAVEELEVASRFLELRRPDDAFIYNVVTVSTFEDALLAVLINFNIQSVVVRSDFPFRTRDRTPLLEEIYQILDVQPDELEAVLASERSLRLGNALRDLRPELDLFLVTDTPVENLAGEATREFRRMFYLQDDYHEQHLSILKGIHERYETPFFAALRRYSLKPTGVFHALPISRGKSVTKSHWIQDMARFYGHNIFQAETSATTGGLDSLSQPVGPIKKAQEQAARAFGARHTYFVTNGTSTANKIVLQALIAPGDIVLLSHDCHKSHPYAVILAGAHPVYLDAYPLSEYSMYGGVPLAEIKRQLLELKRAGKLHRVKMLLLTNITFDGITYDPERVMEEVLAIKPDMIFVWDEAWFAYGRFLPNLRQRTAMETANRLQARFRGAAYRERYANWKASMASVDWSEDASWLERRLLPDPDTVRVRVYATHSTHKTLTALRQGSMIHVNDQDFEHHVKNAFTEAYMTHTSTSPNYQILASLDMGRRQVELEGYELVHKSLELAMTLRERIHADPLLQRYFRVLGPKDMIPQGYRPSGLEYYYQAATGWSRLEEAWHADEFTLDPTRVTLHVGRTGMDGDTFKKLLMDRFDIQINKTSRNTVLFMIHIGMTRGTVAHLVKVLTQIAQSLNDRLDHQSEIDEQLFRHRVAELTEQLPPLPNFSRFHAAFLPTPTSTTLEGDMRKAFFLAYDDETCEYLTLGGQLQRAVEGGREVVSACFVTPYPPGFPVLVPGQVVTKDILDYLAALDVKEIHGYEPEHGLRVFTPKVLGRLTQSPTEPARSARSVEGAQA